MQSESQESMRPTSASQLINQPIRLKLFIIPQSRVWIIVAFPSWLETNFKGEAEFFWMEYLSIFAFWYEMIFYSPLRTLYLGVRGSAHIWCPFVAIWLYNDITLPLGIILMITNDHLMQLWSVFPVLVLCQTLTVQPAVFFLMRSLNIQKPH